MSRAARHRRENRRGIFGGGGGGGVTAIFKFDASVDDITAKPGYSFSRADAATCATYTDVNGVLHLVAANVIRNAHYVNGSKTLLLEPSRTNYLLQGADLSNAAWSAGGSGTGSPTITANNTADPFGNVTAAKLAVPAVTSAGWFSNVSQNPGGQSAAAKTMSAYLKGVVGGELPYIDSTPDGVTYNQVQCALTTAWKRFSFLTGTSNSLYCQVGIDRRNAAEGSSAAMSFWAAWLQLENGSTPTTLIVNGAAVRTRAVDVLSISVPGGAGQVGTLYEKYYDNTDTLQETVSALTTGATYAPTVDRKWLAFKFALGTQTLAAMQVAT